VVGKPGGGVGEQHGGRDGAGPWPEVALDGEELSAEMVHSVGASSLLSWQLEDGTYSGSRSQAHGGSSGGSRHSGDSSMAGEVVVGGHAIG
jgi:hypothetical protein